jgi:hypothetical protein
MPLSSLCRIIFLANTCSIILQQIEVVFCEIIWSLFVNRCNICFVPIFR